MSYYVVIKSKETGVERGAEYEGKFSKFWWAEGNMRCDCNRALQFARAAHTKEELKVLGFLNDLYFPCDSGVNQFLVTVFTDSAKTTKLYEDES